MKGKKYQASERMENLGSLSQTAVPEDNHNWSAFFQIALVERPEVNEAEMMTLRL